MRMASLLALMSQECYTIGFNHQDSRGIMLAGAQLELEGVWEVFFCEEVTVCTG